jgi:hypothetical protein
MQSMRPFRGTRRETLLLKAARDVARLAKVRLIYSTTDRSGVQHQRSPEVQVHRTH